MNLVNKMQSGMGGVKSGVVVLFVFGWVESSCPGLKVGYSRHKPHTSHEPQLSLVLLLGLLACHQIEMTSDVPTYASSICYTARGFATTILSLVVAYIFGLHIAISKAGDVASKYRNMNSLHWFSTYHLDEPSNYNLGLPRFSFRSSHHLPEDAQLIGEGCVSCLQASLLP